MIGTCPPSKLFMYAVHVCQKKIQADTGICIQICALFCRVHVCMFSGLNKSRYRLITGTYDLPKSVHRFMHVNVGQMNITDLHALMHH